MLSAASWLYAKSIGLRNALYEKGIFESHSLSARTISIGNITTGGTGKTPVVAYVAKILAARGEKVCILSRGYGRSEARKRVLVSDGSEIAADPSEAGDEPYELAGRLLGKAMVIADADRVSAAEWAKRKFGVTAFVLDDGFQHRKVQRDVDIVCVDATNPFGGGRLIPAGRLREPVANLDRADIVLITRSDLVSPAEISKLKSQIERLTNGTIFLARNEIVRVIALEEFHAKTRSTLRQQIDPWEAAVASIKRDEGEAKILAFCALGNPRAFFKNLSNRVDGSKTRINLAATRVFPDHHIYTQIDVTELEMEAYETAASAFVTTAKDAVKLSDLSFQIPCFVVEIEVVIDAPAAFAALL